MKKALQLIFFCLSILISCNSSNNNINSERDIKKENDTLLLVNRIDKTKKELNRMHIRNISDSVKFYLYSIFYDEEIKSNNSSKSYFCFYDLEPIFLDNLDSLIIIRYNLVILNKEKLNDFNEITLNMVDVQYKVKLERAIFDKENISVLGKVYLEERLEDKYFNKIAEFLKKHESRVNKWYLTEIRKRISHSL